MDRVKNYNNIMTRTKQILRCLVALLLFACFTVPVSANHDLSGSTLYISPLSITPKIGRNFTFIVRVNSLSHYISSIKGELSFPPDKLEIINISKTGSILNYWPEDPYFSNADGKLAFHGEASESGFKGNNATVIHVLAKPKAQGPVALVWENGEILLKGENYNVLTSLENINFTIEPDPNAQIINQANSSNKTLIMFNMIMLIILLIGFMVFIVRYMIDRNLLNQKKALLDLEHQYHQEHEKSHLESEQK